MQKQLVFTKINVKDVLKVNSHAKKSAVCTENQNRDRTISCGILFQKGSQSGAPSNIQLTEVSTTNAAMSQILTQFSIQNQNLVSAKIRAGFFQYIYIFFQMWTTFNTLCGTTMCWLSQTRFDVWRNTTTVNEQCGFEHLAARNKGFCELLLTKEDNIPSANDIPPSQPLPNVWGNNPSADMCLLNENSVF